MYVFMVVYVAMIRCIIYLNDTCFLPDTLDCYHHILFYLNYPVNLHCLSSSFSM